MVPKAPPSLRSDRPAEPVHGSKAAHRQIKSSSTRRKKAFAWWPDAAVTLLNSHTRPLTRGWGVVSKCNK